MESRGRAAVSKNAVLGLVDSLKSTIAGLRWKPGRGGWASYEEALPYSAEGVDRKRRTAALDIANDLTGLAHALFHGHCAGLGQLAVIVAIAERAAGADRKRTRRMRRTNCRNENT